MSTWPELAYLRPPRADDPPPAWLKALYVYPNAPWVVAERHRRAAGTVDHADACHDPPRATRPFPRAA